MEKSKRDSGQHEGPFALHEITFSVDIACAIAYAVLVYISKSQGSWTPKNDSTYFFLRSTYRVNDLLRLSSIGTVSTREVARQFPSRWSQVGAELLTVVTIFGVASLFVLFLRLVPKSSLYRELLRYVAGATALFATPACYLYVSRLTWNWAPESLPVSSYPSWQIFPLTVLVAEVLSFGILLRGYRGRFIPALVLNTFLFLHYAFWLFVLWPRIGISGFRLYSPFALLLVFLLSGVVWLLYFRLPDTDAIATTESKRAGRWAYFTAAFFLAVLIFVWLPTSGSTSVTHPKNIESLRIQMSRGPCYGRCPSYTVTIHGNGSIEYVGERYVKTRGLQVGRLGREQVLAVLRSLDRAQFPALEDRAFTWCFDSASVGISVSADGSTKRVVSDSYCDGAKAGAQAKFVRAADEIDAILDAKRWLSCDGPCRE
ncbi:MAG: hypothetical protein DMG38_22940 [Acidobacteria bacterium]|nr:MAG: hypothetical protein DMG38_22940 [Acidobacteriota bacterium]